MSLRELAADLRRRGVPRTAAELAAALSATVVGDAMREIDGLAGLAEAGPRDASFWQSPRHREAFDGTDAGIVFVPAALAPASHRATLLIVEAPQIAFARAAQTLGLDGDAPSGIHPTAILGRGVTLGAGVSIGPYAVLEDGVALGAGSSIGPGCVLERDVRVGAACRLGPRVVVQRGVVLGDRVVVHPGAVLGAEGFGFVRDGDAHRKIPQLGALVLEDEVEIGANTTIDRGASGPTIIGRGTKIDNLVQIGHNVRIGERCLLAGQAGVAGSSVLEDDVVLAGQAGVADHLHIGRGVVAAAQAGLTGDVEAGTVVSGYPALPHAQARRVYAVRKRLPEILSRLRAVEAAVGATAADDASA